MKKLLLRWVLFAIAMVVASALTGLILPNGFIARVESPMGALTLLAGVAVLALVNATVGNLLKLLTLPLNCLTFGLVGLVVNAAMLMVVGSLGLGFRVDGFLPALVGSLLLSAANAALGVFVKDDG